MPRPKLQRREKLLFLAPALLLLIPLLLQLRGEGDKMERAQRQLAGPGAINCGVRKSETMENNEMGRDHSAADACATAAFKAGKPYRVRYDNTIVDAPDGPETESSGSVRTARGEVYFFYFRFTAGKWWSREHDYQQARCPEPIIDSGAVGCGTCRAWNCVGTASCIIHPSLYAAPTRGF